MARSQVVAHTLVPALRRQRQVDLSEFKASLFYKSEFQDSQGYTEKPCLEKEKAKTKKVV